MKKALGLFAVVGLLSIVMGCVADNDHDMNDMDMDDAEHQQMDHDETDDD
ncbi:hypothetical protein [Saccharibacillus sp. JS10]|nr:hypothetical protein [Saccharibacillus sp. JS10]MCQ4085431.1 hypothetical protein [Saccharibacillus sp. JS10]